MLCVLADARTTGPHDGQATSTRTCLGADAGQPNDRKVAYASRMSPLDRRGDLDFRYVHYLGHMSLYLDDLEDVIHHLKLNATNVRLTAANAYAENGPEDLRGARRDELENVYINSTKPAIEVELTYHCARVGTNDRSRAAQAVVDDVAALLSPQRRRYVASTRTWLIDSAIVLNTCAVVPFVSYHIVTDGYHPGDLFAVSLPILTLSSVISLGIKSRRAGRALINPTTIGEERVRRTTSRRDTKKQIIIGIITTVIGAALPALLAILNLTEG